MGYALTVYGMGEKLDLALMTGGPPHGVVHRGCGVGADRWEERCNKILDQRGICPQEAGAHTCFYSPEQTRDYIDAAFDLTGETPCANKDRGVLRRNGGRYPTALLDYPQTSVQFLIGQDDCGSGPPLGRPYAGGVGSNSTGPFGYDVIPGAGHSVPASQEGATAIFAVVTGPEGCIPRH